MYYVKGSILGRLSILYSKAPRPVVCQGWNFTRVRNNLPDRISSVMEYLCHK